jgi:Ca2+-binding RTX toxin-like protein
MARIVGNDRNNNLRGTGEDDTIEGRGGSDTLHGRGDDDRLVGGKGADRLDGGDDDDVLEGGAGNDRLTGGDDDDRFVFGKGRDRITDFRPGDDDDDDDDDGGDDRDGDVIDLRDVRGINSFADIRDAAKNKNGDVVLSFSRDDKLTIDDFRVGELERDDFLW